jgi:hypothetical protein
VDFYLQHPEADSAERRKFIADECTFTDGSAGKLTGEYLLTLTNKSIKKIHDD